MNSPTHHRARPLAGRAAATAIAVALLIPAAASAQTATTPVEQAAATARPAVVYIETAWSAYVQDHDGDWLNDGQPFQWTSRCSGFVVNPSGYVVTAGHCVDDTLEGARGTAISFGVQDWIDKGWATPDQAGALYDTGYANWKVEGEGSNSPPDRQVYVQQGVATSGLTGGQAWPARVVEFKPLSQGDVALLKVEQANLSSVLLAADAEIPIGTDILSVGYPASSDAVTDATFEPTYKDGKISSKKTRDGGLLPVYEMSAALSGGMSGGPTVNYEGEVVGLNSYNILGEEQQFNFLSPTSLITEMLSRNGVANELSPVDETYRAGLAAFFAGDRETAMASFDEVLDRVPSHQQAQEFRTRAAQLAAAPAEPEGQEPGTGEAVETVATEDSGGISPLILGTAGVLLIGAVVALVVVGRTRRTGSSVPAPTGHVPPLGPVQQPQASLPLPVGAPGDGVEAQSEVAASTTLAPPEHPSSILCTNCGASVTPTAHFCGSCGSQVGQG